MKTHEQTKAIWLWLLHEGGYWTAAEIASMMERSPADIYGCITRLETRGHIKKLKTENCKKLAYGIDGTCNIPLGLCVAEVQAD